jgi:hypothetical protein
MASVENPGKSGVSCETLIEFPNTLYYGVTGNYRRMQLLYDGTCRALHKWLNRRSQRKSLTWPAVNRLLARFQVPRPRIVEKQGGMPCQLELSLCQHLVHFPRRLTHPLAYARAS